MNPSILLLCLALLCLSGCGGHESQQANVTVNLDATAKLNATAKPIKGVAYFLSIGLPENQAVLAREHISASTLLPLPAKPDSQRNSPDTATKDSHQAFTELKIEVLDLTRLDNGNYRLQLKEPPQVDGVIRIQAGEVVLQALMLDTGSEKRPLRVDAITTAAASMFLKRVEMQRSFNGVDAEQVNTVLSVVNKHLQTLDLPDNLSADRQITWYTEQAQKACTLHLSGLSSSAECAVFTLGGEVKGLAGQLLLGVNQGEPLALNQDGAFMFRTGLINRTHFEVVVKEQPVNQTCLVKYGEGRIHGANVDSVLVLCEENRYQLAGVAEGITGPVKLKLNGNIETLSLKKNGIFQFSTSLKHGTPYEITLAQQPNELTCALSRGAGDIIDNVADISIICEPLLFQVGGFVSGLNGTLRLQMNDAEELSVSQDGEFAFATDFVHKAPYNAHIAEQPAGQTCQLINAQGRLALSDIKNMQISCVNNLHRVGGVVNGLKGAITLSLNGIEEIILSKAGDFRFESLVQYGDAYALAVKEMPQGQACDLVQGAGTVTRDISDIQVNCAPIQYRLGGVVSGLSGAFQLRLNNRQEVLAIPGNGPFEFATRLTTRQTYNVVMDTQPSGQRCSLRNATGRMALADIRSLIVECDFQSFKVGGTVAGLRGSLKLVLNGATEMLLLNSNGMFAFSQELQTGEGYHVSIKTPPAGQQCEVRKGGGHINATNVVDVKIICVPATAAQNGHTPDSSAEEAPGDARTFAAPLPQVIRP